MTRTPIDPEAKLAPDQRTLPADDEGGDLLSERELDETIASLGAIARHSLATYAVAIGRTIIERCFGGSFGDYYERRSNKTGSFNQLCELRREELAALGLSRGTLRRYIVAWDRYRQLPPSVQQAMTLTTLELLGTVPDPFVRGKIAYTAVREGWDTATLRDEVAKARDELRPAPSPPARQPMAAGEREVRALLRSAGKVVAQREAVQALPPDRLLELRSELAAALREVEGVIGRGRRR